MTELKWSNKVKIELRGRWSKDETETHNSRRREGSSRWYKESKETRVMEIYRDRDLDQRDAGEGATECEIKGRTDERDEGFEKI